MIKAPTTTTVEHEHVTWSHVLDQDSDVAFKVTWFDIIDWEAFGRALAERAVSNPSGSVSA